ncbi:hypothetical protein QNI16_02065 [Cytophagaceae bacterium YF14B1]|uniref:Uncharacterized protein n=1 Tax=Xanthocytophaga flava TaxID=3048013 RepID=A0AAE3QI31_9BACT|nr:hypothetical protein [Xanthocytophaga flavus]MDJ1479250.1 hypothetical protein [Xanthocytophaga flavus]
MKFPFHFNRSPRNQNSIEDNLDKLLIHLGFTPTITFNSQETDILGIAQRQNRLSFFIRISSQVTQPSAEQNQTYYQTVRDKKQVYPIKKDFLISGSEAICHQEKEPALLNAAITKALVSVSDPENCYTFLSKIATFIHSRQLSQFRPKQIHRLFSIPFSLLEECPFLIKKDNNYFSFVHFEFQHYFLAQEFSLYEKASFQRKPVFEDYWKIHKYITYTNAPSTIQKVASLLQTLDVKKYHCIRNEMYEVAAQLRDYEKLLHEKFLFSPWPYNSRTTISEVEAIVHKMLQQIEDSNLPIDKQSGII